MSSRNEILGRIRKYRQIACEMPEITIEGITYPDMMAQFSSSVKQVGGEVAEISEGEDINELIRTLYPEAITIASHLKGLSLSTINPDNVSDPHELDGLDLAVIEGELGVAENGCVWIPQRERQKVVYFIADHLVILLNKRKIVNNMHEAYKNVSLKEKNFGVFISGPSKTADIEQALVIGAHGAKGVTVILK